VLIFRGKIYLDDLVANATAFVDALLFVVKLEPQQLELLISRLQPLLDMMRQLWLVLNKQRLQPRD
jgi:hypothetical protein